MFWSVSEAIAQNLIDKKFPNHQSQQQPNSEIKEPLFPKIEIISASTITQKIEPKKSCMSQAYRCFIKLFGC